MDQSDLSKKEELVYGVVEEALPNAMFRVIREDTNETLIAYLAGKMRRFRIRVLVGDRVGMVIDPYGGKARISKRM
jgi:translation initiation factor IF-1